MRAPRLTGLAGAILRRVLDARELRAVESELAELWEARTGREGQADADRWHRREALRLALTLPLTKWRPSLGGAGVLPEVRQAARSLRRAPVSTATIVLTLGLGLGGTAALWAVVDGVLLRPLPYAAPDRLVWIYHAIQGNRWSLSAVDWDAIRAQATEFEVVGAARTGSSTLSIDNESERVVRREVSPSWFDVLGVAPLLGRPFRAADGEPSAAPTVLLGHGFWQRRFGGAPNVVGRTIRLDGVEHEVIGVLPAEAGPLEERYDIFQALRLAPPRRKGPFYFTIIGRLKPGSTHARAEAELRAISARIFPEWQSSWQNREATYGVLSLAETVTGQVRLPLLALLGAVVFVLMVATLNAANLLVARAVERRRELAVRMALGASRSRVVRVLLTESALAATAGAVLGLGLAVLAVRAVAAAGPTLVPRAAGITLLDARVLPVVLLLVAACTLFCGLVPALQAIGGADPGRGLGEGSRSVTGGRHAQRVRTALVAAQFAIAAPLLAGAGLMLNGFVALQRVDTGFDPRGIVTAGIALPQLGYEDDERLVTFWQRMLDGVGALPGVRAAGIGDGRPPRGYPGSNNFDMLDRPTPPGQAQPGAIWLTTSPGYFDVIGARLLQGRRFAPSDGPDTPPVVLVDEAWVRAWSPDLDPVGRRFLSGGCTDPDCPVATVVGVVSDVRYTGLDDTGDEAVRGTIYTLAAQAAPSFSFLHVRSDQPAADVIAAIRGVVRSIDPEVPLFDIATSETLVDEALAMPRNLMLLAGAFAAVALLLAVIAIYGVMAYFVQRHRRDIGIRMALGGESRAVTWLIVRRGMRPVLSGVAVGGLLAIAVARLLAGVVFGVRAADPVTHGGVALLLLGTAFVACALPAIRATRRAPLSALREE